MDQQWYCDHAIKFARWQHPALGHGARFSVSVITCTICLLRYQLCVKVHRNVRIRDNNGSFHFLDLSFGKSKHTYTHRPQGVNYHRYLRVLKYLLFIIIIRKEKGMMQTNWLADV